MIELSHNQPTRLKNVRCAYCNAEFSDVEPEKEHVIGKLFVPKHSFNQQWNLHLNSCHKCNQLKSTLENDISAISMIQPWVDNSEIDEHLLNEAKRKSKTTSRRKGVPVSDSTEKIEITQQLGPNASMTFKLIAPPQADRDRIFQLARYQLAGFFYLMTFNNDTMLGKVWPGQFMPIDVVKKGDWGNPQIADFAKTTEYWTFCFGGPPTAKGYFRALIKRHPLEPLWSWALEWNTTTRIFGFFGEDKYGKQVFSSMKELTMTKLQATGEEQIRFREEIPLADNVDDLFFCLNN